MSDFDWTFPYPSQRMPVLAKNVVATSQPLAANAGLEMMRAGGNAIDAAVAAAITLTVVEPTSNGLGSDAFALVHTGGGLHGFNASGRAPRDLKRSEYDGLESIPYRGWLGVTTPGAVSLWVELSQRFGALPFAQLCEPAVNYARHGFLVSPQTGASWKRAQSIYADFPDWQAAFAPDGSAPGPGDFFASPAHARTIEAIADTKGDAFYRGDIAQRIADCAKANGAPLSLNDLAAHAVTEVRPISIDYRDFTLHEIPPNGQGIVALIALGILNHLDVASLPVDSPASLHLQIEAMKLAFADGHRYVADPEWMDADPADLLDDAYLAARAQLIDPSRAQDFKHGVPKPGGTVYLTTADADGSMVSYIQSNYTGFGSGVVIPGTGVALQNRGCCFSLEQGHPNEVGPGKRPYHTIIPGFVTRAGAPVMSFGVMGGYMQPQGHAQVMVRLADHRQNPQAALDAPRFQISTGVDVSLEPGFDPNVYETLASMGHDVSIADARTVVHGGGQAIYKLDDGYFAASDLRRDGQAVGF